MPARIPQKNIKWASVRIALGPYLAQAPKLRRRYIEIPSRFTKLKKATLAVVSEWEYYTSSALSIDPACFLLDGISKPGHRMDKDPGSKTKLSERYGFDTQGRLVAGCWPDGGHESFWEYGVDRVDGMTAQTDKPKSSPFFRINVESLFLKEGRPHWHYSSTKKVEKIQLFQHKGDHIEKVLWATRDLSGLGDPNRWVCGVAEVTYDGKGNARVRKYVHGGWAEAHTFKAQKPPKQASQKAPMPTLDLRQELKEVTGAITQAIADFSSRRVGDVSAIGLQFMYYTNGIAPEIMVSFDTRADFEDDGEWTHQFVAKLKRSGWGKFWPACEQAGDAGVLIDSSGRKHKVGGEVEPVRWFGQMLAEGMLAASRSAAFKSLQKAKTCKLLVHDIDFAYHWSRSMRAR